MSAATREKRQLRYRSLSTWARGRRGQMIIMTAVVFPVLLGFMGLSLDMGYIYHIKRRMQTAADAGALGASKELWRTNNTLVTNQAKNDTKLNSFADGVNGVTVTVNNPPTSGPKTGNANFVEVIIAQDVPTYFMRIIKRNSATVRARAVAGLVTDAGGCVMALDPTAKGALTIAGSATLTAACGVVVNSNNTQAITENGGGCIYASSVGVTGDWVANGSQNCIYPSPLTEIPPALDPLAYMATPAIPVTPIATNYKFTGGTTTLSPGLYSGGITITGGTVNFQPGTYILDGTGFQVSGNAFLNSLPGGVTFYNTSTGSGKGGWGTFNISGTVTSALSAPTTGAYAGMLFWDDKNAPNKPPGNVINGTSGSSLIGALYFPSTSVNYSGTSAITSWQMIVANTITIGGNTQVYSNYTTTNVPPPTRIASIVE